MIVKKSVWFVLTPPVLLLDYAGPAEAFRMAAESGAPFDLHHCAPLSRVTTSIGTALDGLEPLPDTLPPDSLVVVVGTMETPGPGTSETFDAVTYWLKTVPAADTRIASICSGALLLARAGRLAGRRCTTLYGLVDLLKHEEPTARVRDDCLFVDDGNVLTSAGITAGIDLALYLIERYAGEQLAADIARRQVVYQRLAGEYTQLSPWLAHRNHMHPAVHRAQDAIARDPARVECDRPGRGRARQREASEPALRRARRNYHPRLPAAPARGPRPTVAGAPGTYDRTCGRASRVRLGTRFPARVAALLRYPAAASGCARPPVRLPWLKRAV
jgi:transcriptional regulator GlxA family with amidase domain